MQEQNNMTLDFERNIIEIEGKIEALKQLAEVESVDIKEEVERLQKKLEKEILASYKNVTPWQKTQIARHAERPQCLDYVNALIEDFTPLCGDRCFADDETMITGIGRFKGVSVAIIGQQKGQDLETRVKYNFGMAKPEGYRKAQRMMELAEKFKMPIICFVDTDGAFPGIEAEARGQAEAIASSIEKCLQVKTPIISVVIGVGGSGGAIAIATADRILMLENSIYSIISPEGCASILWRSADKAKEAAEALRLTAQDGFKLKLIDEVIPEPIGGAHRDPQATIENVGQALHKALKELINIDGAIIKRQRTEKFFMMGRNL